MPRFEGVSVKMGEEDFIVPPLNFSRLKKLTPLIEELGAMKIGEPITAKQADAIITVIHSALSRNYPHLTIENVEEMIDLGNVGPIIQAVMGVSGFSSGEKVAGNGLTGIKSTPI